MIWQSLLKQALRVLDNAYIDISPHQWRFGGGTVLMINYGHRMSKDIDLFFSDPQLIDYVSPTTNDALEGEMGDYLDGHHFKRYVLPEGKLDFIKGHPITNLAPTILDFEGRTIFMDSSVEIAAKKIFYRCGEFKPRDVFDQAAVLLNEGEEDLAEFCLQFPDKAELALTKTLTMIDDGALELGLEALDILPAGEGIKKVSHEVVTAFFEKVLDNKPVSSQKLDDSFTPDL